MVLKIGIGCLFCLKATEVNFRIQTFDSQVKEKKKVKTSGDFEKILNFSLNNIDMLHIK